MRLSQVPELHGIWERAGYGDIYVIGKRRVKLYEFTRATCYLSDTLSEREFNELLINFELSDDGRTFTATDPNEPAFRHHYERRDSLPYVCDETQRLQGFVPTQIFDHVWHTFNDYYAFFDERGVDWQSGYDAARSKIDDSLGKRALFARIRKLLSPIDDGHVSLESRSEEFYPEKPRGIEAVLTPAFARQKQFRQYRKYVDWEMRRYESILSSYLDASSVRRAGGRQADAVTWGTIGNRIGYLRIDSMHSISADTNATSLDDIEAARSIMRRALEHLGGTQGMIVDVRFNGGGDDALGLAIASFFTNQRVRAVTKVARDYRGDTAMREAYLDPISTVPYLNPTAVIAGPETASAAEVFVMAMRALPHVVQVGEATQGILSDELYKSLPKGWEFTLSNEVYYDHDGNNYEATGVPPHVAVSTFSLVELDSGSNAAIELARKHLP